ncbi:E3 ubiquitin protein ligase UPL1-like protein [Tanacetum coccineum]
MGLLQVVVYTAASKLESQSHTEQPVASSQVQEAISQPQEDSSSAVAEPKQGDKSATDGLSTSGDPKNVNMNDIFMKLPQTDLHNLCSLLSHERLSATGEVLKKFIVDLSDLAHSLSGSAISNLITLRNTQMLGACHYVEIKSVTLEPLWQELSECISVTESQLAQGSLSTVMSNANTDDAHATASEVKELSGSSSPSGAGVDGAVTFSRFAEKHRRLLNAFVRQNPGLLEKSLSMMLKAPRAYVLEDSYNQLRMRPTQDLKGRLNVHFQGEEGIDAGGLTREWYQLLSRVIFDKGALLFTTGGNNATFQPNPNSVYQTEHLSYFKFVGRVVAKALFDGQLLDVYFTRSFYKHILGVKVTYHDIEAVDPDYYKNLKWLLENDVSDILDLTFSMDADEEKQILYEKSEVTDHELKPGGRNTRLTEETKHEYVDLVAEHILTNATRPQINSFLEGLVGLS